MTVELPGAGAVVTERPAPAKVPRSRLMGALGVLASAALLLAVLFTVDSRAVLDQLRGVNASWLFVSLAASVPQVAALGLRWAHISRGLGVPLAPTTAIREYAIGIALNLTLPTGVVGDAVRSVRHGRHSLLPIVIDRVSGQLALFCLCALALTVAVAHDVVPPRFLQTLLGASVLLSLSVLLIGLWTRRPAAARLRAIMSKGSCVLFAPRSFAHHFSLSSVFLGSTLIQYWAAGRAIGVPLASTELLWFGSGVLLATSIPTFFAGWGVREGASALLFAAAGLSAHDGVATALIFGIFSLIIGWTNAAVAVLWMLSGRLRRAT